MRTRILVAVASVLLYIALVPVGVEQLRERDDGIRDAAEHQIAIEARWWTPASLGLAHGISLPAWLVFNLGTRLAGIANDSDRPLLAVELSLAPLTGLLWFLVVAEGQRLNKKVGAGGAPRRVAVRTAACSAAVLLALLLLWGFSPHCGQIPFSSLQSMRDVFETGAVAVQVFGTCWLAAAINWAVVWTATQSARNGNKSSKT